MNPALEGIADRLLARSPAQALFARRAGRRLAVLAYHGVDDAGRFARQLDYLAARTRPISLAELEQILAGAPAPPRAVLVTFDDGHRSLLEHGLPLLASRRIPALAFVVAGHLDGDAPLWWREVAGLVGSGATARRFAGLAPGHLVAALKRVSDAERLEALDDLRRTARRPAPREPYLRSAELTELVAGGVEIGSHTLSHPCLPRCEDAKVRGEIAGAHDRLVAALGRPPRAFAYPNGDRDPRAERVLDDLGYRAAFLFDHRLSSLPPPNPLAISRVRVNSDTPLDRFRILVSGLHPAIHRRLGRG